MQLAAIRTAVAQAVATVTGLRASGTAMDNPSPPVALVWPGRGAFLVFDTFRDSPDHLILTVTVLVAKATDRGSQDQLDSFLEDTQLWSAFEADQSLGGLVSYAKFLEARNYGLLEWAGVQYLGCELDVEVML